MGLFSILKDKLSDVQQRNRENQGEKTAPKEVFDRMRKKLEDLESDSPAQKQSTGSKGGGLFSILKEKLEETRRENREEPTEETADSSIFDRLKEELEQMESQKDTYEGEAGSDDVWNRVPDSLEVEPPVLKPNVEEPRVESKPNVEPSEEFGSIFDKLENKSGDFNKEHGGGYTPPSYETPKQEQPSDYSSNQGNIEKGEFGRRRFQIGSVAQTDSNGGSLAMRVDPVMGAGTLTTRVPSNADIRILDYSDQNKINIDGQISGWYKVDYQGQQGWILEIYLF